MLRPIYIHALDVCKTDSLTNPLATLFMYVVLGIPPIFGPPRNYLVKCQHVDFGIFVLYSNIIRGLISILMVKATKKAATHTHASTSQ